MGTRASAFPNQASIDQGVHILAQRENGSTGRSDAHIDERVASDTKGAALSNATACACFSQNDCCDVRSFRVPHQVGPRIDSLERRHRSVCCDWLISAVSA